MRFFRSLSRSRSRQEFRAHSQATAVESSVASLNMPILTSIAVAAGVTGLATRRMRISTVPVVQPRRGIITGADRNVDVVLSSGFLSFANHSGFLQACEEGSTLKNLGRLPCPSGMYAALAGLKINGLMGTSAGALSGALYAAGYSPQEIALELSKNPPSYYLTFSNKPWEGGVLNMSKAVQRYRELLPATFEDLPLDFAVGVYTRDGRYQVVDSGPLPEAVVASAAIPFVFENVEVPGVGQCMDGGKYDRVGLEGWRQRCQLRGIDKRPAVVHLIDRSSPFSGNDQVLDEDVIVVRSPKSGVSLASLGNFEEQLQASRDRASSVFTSCDIKFEAE